MSKKNPISEVSLNVLTETVWEVCKTATKKVAVVGAITTASAGSLSLAIVALAGYIGLTGLEKWKALKSDEKQKEILQKILDASTTTRKELEALIPDYYEFFDAKQDIEQALNRIQMLQKVAASIQSDTNQIVEQLKEHKELLKDFGGYVEANYDELKDYIKTIIKDELFKQLEQKIAEDHKGLKEDHKQHDEKLDAVSKKIDKLSPSVIAQVDESIRHNLPYGSIGHLFKGRDDKLGQLQEQLAKGKKTAITQAHAIHGLGGIGKTRLAVEFGWHQIGNGNVSRVFFVLADSLTSLITNLASLAGPKLLDLEEKDMQDQPALVDIVIKTISQMKDCLVIFDNADDEHAIEKLHEILPQLAGCQVLITSRVSNWKGVKKLPIDKLAERDAIAYLLEKTDGRSETEEDEKLAGELAGKLDGLPVVLEQAAAYINYLHIGFEMYLGKFEDARKEVLKWHKGELQDYPEPVLIAWQATEEQLGAAEKSVLRLVSFLSADAIPVELFEGNPEIVAAAIELYKKENGEDTELEKMEEIDIRGVLAELSNWSMITLSEKSFYVHRLVQDSVRLRIPDEALKSWTEISLAMVERFIPEDLQADDVRSWHIWDVISPHVLVVTEHGNKVKIPEPTSWLMNSLAMYYNTKASFEVAEILYGKALDINENTVGHDHPNTASCLNNLAELYRATNRLAEAEPMLKRVVGILENPGGEPLPNYAIALNNLAQLYQDTNRLAEAEPLMERSLAISEASFGKDHPDVAIRLNNLAQLYGATNRLTKAEPLMKRALAISEASFGEDHPSVARDLNNLATLYMDTNRLAEAEPLMKRALAIDEVSFGKDHPKVALRLNNLAQLYKATNRLAEAEPLMKRGLEIEEKSKGENHPHVAIQLNNLAELYRVTDRFKEAEPLYKRALEIDEASLGKDHPTVAIRLNNLALLYQSTGRFAEAEPLMRRALAIDEASFGKNHPNVATDLNNLAGLYQATNRLAEAEPLMERALAIDEVSFGKDHPSVAIRLNNLAQLYSDTSRLAKAEPIFVRALEIFEASLGAEHPTTITIRKNLEILRRKM
ncbi:MAG: tetratricopeptide repeat protein [Planctomycetes bacterium]|nr:tetratricopeptide repeat protein [Planctomycetota bacterium]